MLINMQIVLNQLEMEEAIRNFVRTEVPVAEDQNITVIFEDDKDGNLQAIVVVERGGVVIDEPKPAKATRTRKTNTPVKAAAPEPETEEDAIEAEQAEQAAETTVAAMTQDEPETVSNGEAKSADPAPVNPMKIFPETGTSAPVTHKAVEPTVAAKSLFANLVKPTH